MSGTAHIRAAVEADLPSVTAFLHRELAPHLSATAFDRLFDYQWSRPVTKPNLGAVLCCGEEVVGYQGAIYAERFWNGQSIKTCNLTCWCVLPTFRAHSVALLRTVLKQKEYSFTCFTASPQVGQMLQVLGFTCIDKAKRVYLPWKHLGPILGGRHDWVIPVTGDTAGLLDATERDIFEDHRSDRFRHYMIRRGEQFSYLVLRQRRFPGTAAFPNCRIRKLSRLWYPGLEVVYFSRPGLAGPVWPDVAGAILRRERVCGLVAPERYLDESFPPGAPIEHRSYLLDRAGIGCKADALYSEFSILGI